MNYKNKEDNMRDLADELKIEKFNNYEYKRLIFIGDIHGCYDELMKLLNEINYDSNNDLVISVGDIMAKGPKSFEVLNFFINNNCRAVLGNHDYAVLRWYTVLKNNIVPIPFGLKQGSEHQELAKNLNDQQFNYLKNLPHVLLIEKYNLIVLHAGINVNFKLENNNSFDIMHIRNIMDNCKGSELISNGSKWIDLWNGPQTIIFGHDAMRGIQLTNHAIGLDTGCVYGKYLTCLIFPENKIVSIPAIKSYTRTNESALK